MVTKRGFVAVPLIILGTLVATSVILLTSNAAKQKFAYIPRATACYEQTTGYGSCTQSGCHQRNVPGDPDNGKWFKCSGEWKGPCDTQAQCEGTSGGGGGSPAPSNPPSGGGGTGDWCCAGVCASASDKSTFIAVWGANAQQQWYTEAEKNLNQPAGSCSGGGGGGGSPAPSSPPSGGGGGGTGGSCDGGYNWDSASVGCSGGSKLDCICGKLTSGSRPCNSPGSISGNTVCMGNKWDCTWGCTVPKPQPTNTPVPTKKVTQPPAQPPGGGAPVVPPTNVPTLLSDSSCVMYSSKAACSAADGCAKFGSGNFSCSDGAKCCPIAGKTPSCFQYPSAAFCQAGCSKGFPGYSCTGGTQDYCCPTGASAPPASDGNWVRCDDTLSNSCDEFCKGTGSTCVPNSGGFGSREQESYNGSQTPLTYGKCSDTTSPVYQGKPFVDYCTNSYNLYCNCQSTSSPQTGAQTIVTFTGTLSGAGAYANLVMDISSTDAWLSAIVTACGGTMDKISNIDTNGQFSLAYIVKPSLSCNATALYSQMNGKTVPLQLNVHEATSATNLTPNPVNATLGQPTVSLGVIALPPKQPAETSNKVSVNVRLTIGTTTTCFNNANVDIALKNMYELDATHHSYDGANNQFLANRTIAMTQVYAGAYTYSTDVSVASAHVPSGRNYWICPVATINGIMLPIYIDFNSPAYYQNNCFYNDRVGAKSVSLGLSISSCP